MKHVLLLLLITCAFAARANDTLTVARVYNFNVGDTFDYEENVTAEYLGYQQITTILDTVNFTRFVIINQYYSQNSDTLFIVRQRQHPLPFIDDTIILDSLQFPAAFVISHMQDCSPGPITFDSISAYNNRATNENFLTCPPVQVDRVYAQGLGPVSSKAYAYGEDWFRLIYYARGATHWGTPYYVADSSALVHYTPIPEECATWYMHSEFCPPAYQKISTGNRIAQNGHTYVAMNFSYFDSLANKNVSDSLIGYFRNDTLNQKVYLYHTINEAPFLTYDFTVPAQGFVLQLSQVNVGGQSRTFWYEDCQGGGNAPGGYIEGVGGAFGLCQVFQCTPEMYLNECNTLTCFSVCGQTLYPYDSTANCSLAGINNIAPATPAVKVYPTVNNGLFNVQVLDQNIQDAQLLLTDITGREIKRCALNNELNNISIQQYADGMYLWRVLSHDKLVQAGKLIKE